MRTIRLRTRGGNQVGRIPRTAGVCACVSFMGSCTRFSFREHGIAHRGVSGAAGLPCSFIASGEPFVYKYCIEGAFSNSAVSVRILLYFATLLPSSRPCCVRKKNARVTLACARKTGRSKSMGTSATLIRNQAIDQHDKRIYRRSESDD